MIVPSWLLPAQSRARFSGLRYMLLCKPEKPTSCFGSWKYLWEDLKPQLKQQKCCTKFSNRIFNNRILRSAQKPTSPRPTMIKPPRTFESVIEELQTGLSNGSIIFDGQKDYHHKRWLSRIPSVPEFIRLLI